MAASALSQPGAIHRAWGLFLLDHGRDVERVLAEARSSLDERRDVYTYDLLAWALYRAGRVEDARRAAAAALAQGTEDAQLYYHAGMIALAARDTAEGRALLERALALNPRVSATAATASR
jgi:tetratricopeptide (TPR) repeat protein